MRDFHGVHGTPNGGAIDDHGEPGLGRPPLAVRKTHGVLAELAGNGMEDRR